MLWLPACFWFRWIIFQYFFNNISFRSNEKFSWSNCFKLQSFDDLTCAQVFSKLAYGNWLSWTILDLRSSFTFWRHLQFHLHSWDKRKDSQWNWIILFKETFPDVWRSKLEQKEITKNVFNALQLHFGLTSTRLLF